MSELIRAILRRLAYDLGVLVYEWQNRERIREIDRRFKEEELRDELTRGDV